MDHEQAGLAQRYNANPNDLPNSYRRISTVVRTPATRWLRLTSGELAMLSHASRFEKSTLRGFAADFAARIDALVETPLAYPVFIKNGLFSNKHDWDNSCVLSSREQAFERFQNIFMDAELAGHPPSLSCVVRELLDVDAKFTAFGEGTPICREIRFFTRNGRVEGFQPYWPRAVIRDPSVDDWTRIMRDELNVFRDADITYLSAECEKHHPDAHRGLVHRLDAGEERGLVLHRPGAGGAVFP